MTESLQSRYTVIWWRDWGTAAPDITVVVLILSKSGKFMLVRHLTLAFFSHIGLGRDADLLSYLSIWPALF